MAERDRFADLIAQHGPPRRPHFMANGEAETYRGRVPNGMIEFWLKYGRGEYRDGYYRICDPAPFAPVLRRIFAGDPDLNAADITLLSYDGFGYAALWNRNGFTMSIDFEKSTVGAGRPKDPIDPDTGKPFTADFLVGSLLDIAFSYDTEWYEMACSKLGRPGPDEIFAYAPLLQLGGVEDLDNVRRVEVTTHMDIVAQLEPFTLIELSDPEPDAPLGRLRPVRRIGPQQIP